MKLEVESLLKPGDLVERVKGRMDTFLGLFEWQDAYNFSKYGWYALMEFTEARGRRVKTKVTLFTLLARLKEPWTTETKYGEKK
jgi:hypothetical protein